MEPARTNKVFRHNIGMFSAKNPPVAFGPKRLILISAPVVSTSSRMVSPPGPTTCSTFGRQHDEGAAIIRHGYCLLNPSHISQNTVQVPPDAFTLYHIFRWNIKLRTSRDNLEFFGSATPGRDCNLINRHV